jgi:hypothetical protein
MFGGRVVSFPIFFMGQYFRAVNKTKKEVVCPWCIGGGAKLWEWAANPLGAVFVLLLRKSSGSGGGDYWQQIPQIVELTGTEPADFAKALATIGCLEGAPAPTEPSIVGRWAGDEVYLVGDYDSSRLYQESCGYRNISEELVTAWNSFIDLDDHRLELRPTCNCREFAEE